MCYGKINLQGLLLTIRANNTQTWLQIFVKTMQNLTKFANFFINNAKLTLRLN